MIDQTLLDTYMPIGLVIIMVACNVASRVIPDKATGFLGVVRQITSVVGVHVRNRVEKGVTTEDMALLGYTNKVDVAVDRAVETVVEQLVTPPKKPIRLKKAKVAPAPESNENAG